MITLMVNQNQIEYRGVFKKPAFNLWGKSDQILEGLYSAFSSNQLTLSDFQKEEDGASPSNSGVSINLKTLGRYRFRFDRVEWIAANIGNNVIAELPELLKKGEDWLRAVVPDISFISHIYIYAGHCQLSEGTSQEYLLSLPRKEFIDIGQSLGHGILHNWFDHEIKGRVQLMVDHSLSIQHGLYIQFLTVVEGNQIDHSAIVSRMHSSLIEVMNKIGLQFETEQEVG